MVFVTQAQSSIPVTSVVSLAKIQILGKSGFQCMMSSVLDTHPDLGPLKLEIQTPNLSKSWLLVHDEFSAGFTS
jgi:hypothetical protein